MKKTMMVLLMVLATTAVFAGGQTDDVYGHLTTTVQREVPYVGDFVQVPSTSEINEYFQEAGIDLKYLNTELSQVPEDIRDDIDTVIDDNDLGDLAKAEVKSWVQKGQATYAYMLLGRQVFTFQAD